MDTSLKQKVHEETVALNNTLEQMDLTDTYRTFHPRATEYTSSQVHLTFSRLDYMVDYQINLHKYKKTKITPDIFSKHNGMKLEVNYSETGKSTDMWKLSNRLLNN